MTKLVGRNPEQVPSNADLGTMAYQDADRPALGQTNVKSSGTSLIIERTGDAPNLQLKADGQNVGHIYGFKNGSGGNIAFYPTNSSGVITQRMLIYSGGNVSIIDGNLIMANGHGIDFSATGDGSGTTTSEILDDYEEGTFTPTIIGSGGNPTVTYDTTYTGGRYTKIGNLVYINAEIRCSSISGGSGQVGMAGMPFARNGNYKSDASPTTTQLYNVTYTGFVTANIARSSSTYEFSESNSGSATSSILISDLSASPIFILRVNGVYDVS